MENAKQKSNKEKRRGEGYKRKKWTNGGEDKKRGVWWRKEYMVRVGQFEEERGAGGGGERDTEGKKKKTITTTPKSHSYIKIHFAFHQSSSCKVSSTLSFVKFYVFICEYVHFFYSHLQHIIRKKELKTEHTK